MGEPQISFEDARDLFAPGYTDWMCYDDVEEITPDHHKAIHYCTDCDVYIPLSVSDPQAYGPLMCPECGTVTDTTTLQSLAEND